MVRASNAGTKPGRQSVPGAVRKHAAFSRCRRYRYALWRTWNPALPRVMFIGLNPSIADETRDDPTLRRCMRFAQDWGYGGVCTGNVFALRATDPREMLADPDPVGPDNDAWLIRLAEEAELVVAAWGNHGAHLRRSAQVRALLPGLHCLALNRSGEPAHPLYQPARRRPRVLPPS